MNKSLTHMARVEIFTGAVLRTSSFEVFENVMRQKGDPNKYRWGMACRVNGYTIKRKSTQGFPTVGAALVDAEKAGITLYDNLLKREDK